MKECIRTFIAIKIKPESKFLELLNGLKTNLKDEEIKWVDQSNFHLTLRFLGETSPRQISEIRDFLENICQSQYGFKINLKGIGIFEKNRTPRVLFINVEKNSLLKELADKIEEQAVSLEFKRSKQIYKPHLTLGRIKFINKKDNFYSLVKEFSDTEIQQLNVLEIIYYESILSSETPVYKEIKTIRLK